MQESNEDEWSDEEVMSLVQTLTKHAEVSAEELQTLLSLRQKKRVDFVLVDIREVYEYTESSISGTDLLLPMSLEMLLDIEIFKNQGPIKEATLVPLVFPLLAGAGAFTTLLSLRAEYASFNIILALILNMVWVYFVVKMTDRVERFLGKGGIYIIRKFFGIILLAISVRLFTANITLLMEALNK